MSVQLPIHLMSGEVVTITHPLSHSLSQLKSAISRHCEDWKPSLQTLFRKDSHGEYHICSPRSFTVSEGESLYLALRVKPIVQEHLTLIYRYEDTEMYIIRFPVIGPDSRWKIIFTAKGDRFSMDYSILRYKRKEHTATWYDSLEQMIQAHIAVHRYRLYHEDVIPHLNALWMER